MCKKTKKFEAFIAENLSKVLEKETKDTLGDRSKYIGASDIGDCPYKTVMSKRHPPKYDLKQQIIFQRGHLAENLVTKMLQGLPVVDQFEVLKNFNTVNLKAHLDKLIQAKDRCVIVEVKTVSAPIESPYESWILQVQFQMGLMLEQCNSKVEAYVLAMDLNTGWLRTFYFEFDQSLYDICLNKAQHIEDAMEGKVEPKAIIQMYCGTCPFKMTCPKQGKFAEDLPHDLKLDLEFIKKAEKMEKEAKLRSNRVKNYLNEMNIELSKDVNEETVVSLRKYQNQRFDTTSFKKDYPKLYEQYQKTSTTLKMTVA